MRKNGINYLYELRGKSYEDILKISNNDHKSVDKLVNTVAKYGIFIDKKTDESNWFKKSGVISAQPNRKNATNKLLEDN